MLFTHDVGIMWQKIPFMVIVTLIWSIVHINVLITEKQGLKRQVKEGMFDLSILRNLKKIRILRIILKKGQPFFIDYSFVSLIYSLYFISQQGTDWKLNNCHFIAEELAN